MSAPLVQVAFDVPSVGTALDVLAAIAPEADIVEAGTVLCLSEGLGAVRALRAAYPEIPLTADIRIARAGRKFADMAFDAGADRVTVIGESPHDVVAGAVASAQRHEGVVEVELGPAWTPDDVRRWRDLGVASLIVHRAPGVAAKADIATRRALAALAEMDIEPMTISLAGGLSTESFRQFDVGCVGVVVVGSAIVDAVDPVAALRQIRAATRSALAGARS
jgi:3-keto-L-gulonate-6-phosphate decarboxylase